jgi:hypothetical protein
MPNFGMVATDILLAQNATITRGLVIGTDGSNDGFIRSTDADNASTGTGFYFHEDGTSWMGNKDDDEVIGITSDGTVTLAGWTVQENRLYGTGASAQIHAGGSPGVHINAGPPEIRFLELSNLPAGSGYEFLKLHDSGSFMTDDEISDEYTTNLDILLGRDFGVEAVGVMGSIGAISNSGTWNGSIVGYMGAANSSTEPTTTGAGYNLGYSNSSYVGNHVDHYIHIEPDKAQGDCSLAEIHVNVQSFSWDGRSEEYIAVGPKQYVTLGPTGTIGDDEDYLEQGIGTFRNMFTNRYSYVKYEITKVVAHSSGNTSNITIEFKLGNQSGRNDYVAYKNKMFVSARGIQQFASKYLNTAIGGNQSVFHGANVRIERTSLGTGGILTVGGEITVGNVLPDSNYDIYTAGDIASNANIIAYASSDERLKENILPLGNGLEIINKLEPIEFDWKTGSPGWGTKITHDFGLIAQDVQKIVPDLVGEMDKGWLGLRYEKIIPFLISAVKEQQKQIEELKQEVKEIKDGSSK